jgi:hypothetical protein
MRRKPIFKSVVALILAALFLAMAGCGPDPFYIDVLFIEGVPENGEAGTPLALTATVRPAFASYKDIIWSVRDAGTTEAVISGNILNANADGTVVITARIQNGLAVGKDYTQDFIIVIGDGAPPITKEDQEYTIEILMLDNVTGDEVTVSPDKGFEGSSVTLSYTVANTAHYNQLDFGGVSADIASVLEAGTGTRTYMINASDASNGVITITAVFTHTDLEIDHIAFNEHDGGHIQITYGELPFTNAITTAHHGSGAITYHSSDENVAAVNGSGQVTILRAGSAVISAEKAADAIYAHARTTYTLTVNPKSVTITGLSASDKVYDGTTTATVTGTAVINGLISGDDVTVITGTASFADAAVGNNKTVTFNGWSLTGEDADNYTLPAQPATVTANIFPDGSADYPFLVANEADLRKVGTGADGWTVSAHYRQTADIAMTTGNFTPIGNSTNNFLGVYDGDGYTITGLIVTGTSNYQGLFGIIGATGTVKNVNLSGTITQNGADTVCTGGIAGVNQGTIDNCVFNGTVNGLSCNQIGGITGLNNGGTVKNSRNNATVNGRNNVGGIAGINQGGAIEDSYNTGAVSGVGSVGGVTGLNSGGTVINSRNTATVTGTTNVGGIAGINQAKIDNCYNTGTINANEQAGGIAGGNTGSGAFIKNSYNTGNVTSSDSLTNAGGIAAVNQSGATIEYCYNTGNVSSGRIAGGIVGSNSAGCTVQDCVSLGLKVTAGYSTGRVVSSINGPMTNNKARMDMKIGASGTEATASGSANGGNGADVSVSGMIPQFGVFAGWDSSIWNISGDLTEGGDLPTLKDNTQIPAPTLPSQSYPLGSAANPFLVTNEADLRKVGTGADGWTLSVYYKQTADIAMTGGNFPPIGNNTTKFTGSYDGDGKTITGLTINGTANGYIGVFGFIDAGGMVKKMNVTGTITQTAGTEGLYTGGIVGLNFGTIDNCSFSGTISGTNNDDVGGIAGRNTGTVINSTSNATVSGKTRVGGITGENQGKIDNSYNTGAVTGSQQVGGIAGGNSNSGNYIKNSYNTGNVTATTATTTANAGGIVGQSSALIEYCYNTGNVSGTGNIGGIVGYINPGCTVRYCVSLGARVTGTSTGRIAGTNNGGTLSTNSARADMKVGASGAEAVPTTNIGATATNGASVTVGTAMSTFFSGWDTTTIWNTGGNLTVGVNLPTLKTNTQSPAPTLPASP